MQGLSASIDPKVTTSTGLRSWFRRQLSAYWAVIGIAAIVATATLGPLLISTSPTEMGQFSPLQSPTAATPFGTDQLGRDALSRVLYGMRLSLLVAGSATGLALLAGSLLGAVAATTRRSVGEAIMRLVDVGLAFPGILLALVLVAAIGPSLWTTVLVLSIIYTFPMARVVRASIFDEYGEDYVTAARLLGSSKIRVVGYHVGLNAATPVLVYTTLILGDAILAEAALSFLGAGIRPPAPSLGNIIREGQEVIQAGAWWLSAFPGIVMVGIVSVFNYLAEEFGKRLGVA